MKIKISMETSTGLHLNFEGEADKARINNFIRTLHIEINKLEEAGEQKEKVLLTEEK